MKFSAAPLLRIVCLSILLISGGCASITGTPNQSISVQTREQSGQEVLGAACELTNNKGKWFVTTPGSAMITRSNDNIEVMCKKTGLESGRASVESATKGSMVGNLIFGGGVGAIIDHNTGAAYEYPTFFQVVMGAFTKVAPPDLNAAPSSSSAAANTSPPVSTLSPQSTAQNQALPQIQPSAVERVGTMEEKLSVFFVRNDE